MSELVREHVSQHEAAERLPLVTESAVVTDTMSLDHNRVDEVVDAVASLLEEHDRAEWLSDDTEGASDVDWDAIDVYLDKDNHDEEHFADRLESLRERFSRPYPSLLACRFHSEEAEFEYAPGQYVTVRFHGTPRPYSVANSPNEPETEICFRRVSGGRLTTDLFEDLEEGDEITIHGPSGEFVLKEPSRRDMAFIATGTGVAPLKAMIDYTFEEDRDILDGVTRDVWLFLGSSWEDDLPYHEDFRAYDENHENFHYVPTLSRENYLTDWDGETAYVQRTFLKYLEDKSVDPSKLEEPFGQYVGAEPASDIDAEIDPKNLEVYACGINAMVYPLVDVVRAAGVPEDRIESEGYG